MKSRIPTAATFLIALAALHSGGCGSSKPAAKKTDAVETPAVDENGDQEGKVGDPKVVNSIGMTLVLVPAGQFSMGGTSIQGSDNDEYTLQPYELPIHKVTISKPFYLSAKEVTVAQFREFVAAEKYKTDGEKDEKGGQVWHVEQEEGKEEVGKFIDSPKYVWTNPGYEQKDEFPVVEVTHDDAEAFCRWLSKKENKKYRLPTEAEWEFACRAEDPKWGLTTVWSFGDDLEKGDSYAFFKDNSSGKPHPVGSKEPNRLGLYDMHGNVGEWVQDWYAEDFYAKSPDADPAGPQGGRFRLVRGGNWTKPIWAARSSNREPVAPQVRNNVIGFRVLRELPPPAPPKPPVADEKKS